MKTADGLQTCDDCKAWIYVDLEEPPKKCHACQSKNLTVEEM